MKSSTASGIRPFFAGLNLKIVGPGQGNLVAERAVSRSGFRNLVLLASRNEVAGSDGPSSSRTCQDDIDGLNNKILASSA